jgi:hypothetical protein
MMLMSRSEFLCLEKGKFTSLFLLLEMRNENENEMMMNV